MSHVARVVLNVKPEYLDCLISAAEAIGLEVRRQPTYKWYGEHVADYPLPEGFRVKDLGRCEFALGVKGNNTAYEIGVCKNPNGDGHVLLWDFWAGGYGLQEVIGEGASKLKKAFAEAVARKHYGELHQDIFVVEENGTQVIYANA